MSVVKYALVVFRLCYFAKGSINKTKAVLQWSTSHSAEAEEMADFRTQGDGDVHCKNNLKLYSI